MSYKDSKIYTELLKIDNPLVKKLLEDLEEVQTELENSDLEEWERKYWLGVKVQTKITLRYILENKHVLNPIK